MFIIYTPTWIESDENACSVGYNLQMKFALRCIISFYGKYFSETSINKLSYLF